MQKAENFYKWYGQTIIEKYRKVRPTDSKYLKAPTFREFVEFLVDLDIRDYNEHWLPYHMLCLACHLKYDIIAHTETMNMDRSRLQNADQ